MRRDLTLAPSIGRRIGAAQAASRPLPLGIGLLIGAGASVALWVGIFRLVTSLFL